MGNRGPERTASAGSEGARVAAFAPDPSGHLTVKVKVWVAVPELLVAVMVKVVTPTALGVPEIVALPLPLLVKVTPAGSDPVLPSVGTGYPVAVTVKLNAVPWVAVVELALVILGSCPTVRVKAWVAVPVLFLAVMVNVDAPPAAGVPEMVALPLPLLVKVSPAGSAPVSVRVGAG